MHKLAGIYAAAVTPADAHGAPQPEDLPRLLDFLAERGCHGALLLGTTGEGPSFSPEERLSIMRAATRVRETRADFRLLAGTGTPSLSETIALTRAAFDLGFDGVVVLPPYYFRDASEDGLYQWFAALLQAAVPADGALLGYHIPQVSGVGLSLDLLARLHDRFPNFVGIKDSTGSADHAAALGARFGDDLLVLSGNDRLLTHALAHHAGGAITALANVASPWLREVWEAHQQGRTVPAAQATLNRGRDALEAYPPFGPTLKALLHTLHGFPRWGVRPPLLPLAPNKAAEATLLMAKALKTTENAETK